jgi:hypothetical protein
MSTSLKLGAKLQHSPLCSAECIAFCETTAPGGHLMMRPSIASVFERQAALSRFEHIVAFYCTVS